MDERKPVAYTYSRASSHDKEDVANSVPAQEKRTRAYYDMKLEDQGVQWGGSVTDGSVSASRKRFDQRPGGKLLLEKLQRGDHLIFDKLDRMWRSVYDFERLHRYFETHGIIWHVVNQSGVAIDTSAPAGKAMVTVMIAFAELEAGMASERQKASIRHRREQGRPINQPRLGTKHVKRFVDGTEQSYVEWDHKKRMAMRTALRLLEKAPTVEEAHDDFCEILARQQGRTFKRTQIVNRPISWASMVNWAAYEKIYQELEADGVKTAADAMREIYARGIDVKKYRLALQRKKRKQSLHQLPPGEKKPQRSSEERMQMLMRRISGKEE